MQEEGRPVAWPNSLGPEVISSQLGIINVHDHPGVLCLGAQDLGAKTRRAGSGQDKKDKDPT